MVFITDYTAEEMQQQEADFDAYMTARAEHEQRLMCVMCDICDAEDYGTAKRLTHSGWTLGGGSQICWRHD